HGISTCSTACSQLPAPPATSRPTRTSPRWRSSTSASCTPTTTTSLGFPACAGETHCDRPRAPNPGRCWFLCYSRDMGVRKPSMFIGSSVEGKRIAETIQMVLDYEVQCTVWTQGAFGLSGATLESLVAALDEYDFATLVLTADDLLEKRDT